MLSSIFCTAILCHFAVLEVFAQPEVILEQGILKGFWATSVGGRTYSTFLGVPYAEPPIGDRRFKEPSPASGWKGTYNATRAAPPCLQYSHMTMNTPFAVHGSEDCLYLNVYTPRLVSKTEDQRPLDVIVFIHGGAFMFLSSTFFDASILMDRDVILVSMNYRLGPLGFLSTGDDVVPGNNGMKDQVEALRWVRKNIAAFGGNPRSVTISGFSAGGASVDYHVLSPLSKGLFQAAICMSGVSLNPWTFAENVREKANFIASQLGCPNHDSRAMIECLRNRPGDHIVGTTEHLLPWLYNPFSPYALVAEPPSPNAFLPATPINILKERKASDVPLLLTFTKEEGLYPGAEIAGKPENLNELKNRWNELLPHLLDYNHTVPCEKRKAEISQKIKEYYNIDLDTKEGVANLIKAMSDRIFIQGIGKAAKLHGKYYQSPVYLYRFSYMGKYTCSGLFGGGKELGVSHADDIMYILRSEAVNTQETEADRQVSKELVNLWVSFAANKKLNAQVVRDSLPKIAYTDIQGPNKMVPTIEEQLGEEQFWDSLKLMENLEKSEASRDEL
ncbi:unnamed protein product [Nezara viridula]|uniref:Carboxylic ester hydrolase n=1 Tax=Nezara viridula TaxID=85310 RepID=A0A9P0H0I7_NEZVI|nr:unnamed protein product [Nezara viridula]